MYLKTSPRWLRILYPTLQWDVPSLSKTVYLTFDDGPTPEVTDWVLEQLADYGFKATFFLIGKNIAEHPELFEKLAQSGHALGNHTYHHLKGWKTSTQDYLVDFRKCEEVMETKLFRPPYGRITRAQAKQIAKTHKVMMWSILSGDFDQKLSGEECFENVRKHLKPGAIIVFHDSVKGWPRLKTALPKTLEYLKIQGYTSEKLMPDLFEKGENHGP